ncbi:MAG: signal peptidase II [Burkholderiaceae bacterium]
MPSSRIISNLWPWLALSAVIIGLDQLTKQWILDHYQLGDSTVVTSFFNIVRVHNPGAAFSFLAGASGWQREFFIAIAAIAAIVITYLLAKHGQQKLFSLSLALILGGALGNVIDRFLHGYVVDFLDFHYKNQWHWPAFNLADSAIVGGAILLIVDEIVRMRKSK